MAHAGDVDKKAEDLPKEPDDPVKNIVGNAFGALSAAILAGLSLLTFHYADTVGWALMGLIWFAEIIFIGALTANFIRDFGVLGAGADAIGSRKRRAYDALREDLKKGGRPATLYIEWLHIFLDAIERFFGDAGMAHRTLFPHAFGLRMPAPLWTAPALDRCLLLALAYPILTILVIWVASGHVGPAEATLQLKPGLPGWERGLAAAAVTLCTFAYARTMTRLDKLNWWWAAVFLALVYTITGAIGIALGIVLMAALPPFAFTRSRIDNINIAGLLAYYRAMLILFSGVVYIAVVISSVIAGTIAGAHSIAGVVVGISAIVSLFFGVPRLMRLSITSYLPTRPSFQSFQS
jgi:hypothetical protein